MKNQFIRRAIALVLSVTFLFSLTVSSSAANNDISKNQKKLLSSTKISEYDLINQLKNRSDEELKEKGLSQSEIKEIKDFDYIKELKKIAKNNNKDLSSMGYSTDEISLLKDSNSTDAQLSTLSAVLTLDLSEYGHFYNSTLSEVYLQTSFSWDSYPVFYGTDILAIAWSDGMYCNVNTQTQYQTYCAVNYYDNAYNNLGQVNYTVIANTNTGAYVKIPQRAILPSGSAGRCLNGYMQTYITKQARVPEIAVLSQYGHSTVSISPTVNITGAPSMSFSSAMTTSGEASSYINLTIPY